MNPSSSLKRTNITNYCDDVMEPNCKRMKDDAMEQTIVHDVFVNFSEDTANGFSAHLRGALRRHGFTLFDHTMLPSGHEVCSELLKPIKESGIYVVVFSVKYAHFERCLDELVDIMDCFHKLINQRKVLPVFFNVEPSDVRKQVGSYEEAFAAHEANFDCKRVQKWRQAMEDAGGLSGHHLQNGDEEMFVRKIVDELEQMKNPQEHHVPYYLVGIGPRVQQLISDLRLDCEGVSIVAVLGLSGIGKTTIVKVTYDTIASKFEARCFLADIQDYRGRPNWKVALQKQLISSLAQYDKKPIMRNHTDGVTMIIKLISRRKVLLVLDDVSNFEELNILGIHPNYFHHGSRIIVTTRDESSLGNLPYTSYDTRLLDCKESVELSTRLTFEQDEVIDEEVVKEIQHCAAGLPLVLEILSIHFRRLERKQWPSELKKLKRIPHDDVQKKLKMSYDSLTNRQKKLFLDIACFFVYVMKHEVVKVLEDEELAFFPDVELQKLLEKGLVRIKSSQARVGHNAYQNCSMHDAIQKMGEEIVRQENEDDPGQRTRLSDHRDVLCVLRECSGTKSVESIRLLSRGWGEEKVTIQVEAIRKMSNLRLIQLVGDEMLSWTSSNDDMPPLSFKKLRYLEWWRFPFKSLFDIDMPNVVMLQLKNSKLERLWEGSKSLKRLRALYVSNSSSLTRAHNFSGLENLEELDFSYCQNLEELDNSLGCLDKLVALHLCNCKRLSRFPLEEIGKLRSLKVLNLTGCRNIGLKHDDVIDRFLYSLKECRITSLSLSQCNILKISDDVGSLTWLECLDLSDNGFPSLPEGLGKLHQLTRMDLSDCGSMHLIAKLPPNIRNFNACNCTSLTNLPSNMSELKSQRQLLLNGCMKLGSGDPECLVKLIGLTNLDSLDMSNCNVSQVPIEIGKLVSLTRLDLSGNTFSSLPDSFRNLSRLLFLYINDCDQLRSLPLLPSCLKEIKATRCRSLDVMPFASKQRVDISDCSESICSSGSYAYEFSRNILQLYKKSSFIAELDISLSNNKDNEVPNWCNYRSRRHTLSFVAPPLLDKKIYGMILCADVGPNKIYNISPTIIHNTTRKTMRHISCFGDSLLNVKFYPLDDTTIVVEAGETVVVEFPQEDSVIGLNEFGLRLIYKDDEVDPKFRCSKCESRHANH